MAKSWDLLPKSWGGAYSASITQAIKRLEERAKSQENSSYARGYE
jgi:hypothetical protein